MSVFRAFRGGERRTLGLVAATVVVGALLSPALVATSAQAAPDTGGYVGVSSGTGGWSIDALPQMVQNQQFPTSSLQIAGTHAGCGNFSVTGAPAGINVIQTDGNGGVQVNGIPRAAGPFDLVISMQCSVPASETFILTFTGSVTAAAASTVTTISAPVTAPYTDVPLTAHVATATSGSVQFMKGLTDIGDPVPVGSDGSAVLDAVLPLSDVPSNWDFSAVYLGDDSFLTSTSAPTSVDVYGGSVASGTVTVEGAPVAGATVDLLDRTTHAVVESDSTDSTGAYSFALDVTTIDEATTEYFIRATLPAGTRLPAGTQLFYNSASAVTSAPNIANAELTGPLQWTAGATEDLYYVVAPTWTDSTIGILQAGQVVHDGVTATGSPTIVYSVSAGSLPDGLQLDTATGAITGTPTTVELYDFTITATNAAGHVDQRFQDFVRSAAELDLDPNFVAGTALADASVGVSGIGLTDGSTYTLTLYSTPVVLATGSTVNGGAFNIPSTSIPADTPVGAHELILTAVALDGTTVTKNVWFTVLANGTIGGVSLTGPVAMPDPISAAVLAFTGSDAAVPLEAGTVVLLLGAALLLLRRRRPQR